ncbi:MAG: hypothetical protein NWQ68_00370 [Ilumatobacteraceae bacterium]|nr:hypothetical protein [Ilumatobacteraceae bacterium]
MHSRVYVCDEIGDLLVALTKCPNAPILIVVEIHGAIHVLIHAVISVPEVVPVHLVPLLDLVDHQDLVRAALLALVIMTAAVIHAPSLVVAIVIVHPVVNLAIVQAVIEVRVVILAIVQAVIVVHVVNSVIDLLVILLVAIVIVHPVVMALMPVEILVIAPVAIVVLVVSTATARPVIALLVVTSEIVLVLIVDPVVSTETDQLAIVDLVAILATDPVVTVGRVLIVDPVVSTETDQLVTVDRAVNMATVRSVAMTAAVILAVILVVAIVIEHLVEISETVIVRLVVNSVIVRPAVMIQVLTHVAATETVLLVAMAQALVAHRARVVMTAVMPETEMAGVVDHVAKTSHLADQRTKLNVAARPCACAVAEKSAKTVSKPRSHAKPRPGLMKVELKTTYAMLPKVPCAVRSHRDALCRRDQKMKTN